MDSMLILLCLLCSCISSAMQLFKNESDHFFRVDYDNERFVMDGEPFRYISGSIHYFRIHPDQWLDRLKRVRALGFNAIQYYIPWNYHELERGRFDFTGARNFVRFSRLAESLGMFTLLGIGPYSGGEWENGGLPYWLVSTHRKIKLRTNDTRFITEVSRWFTAVSSQIIPLLYRNGGPVLMVQIENEYGSHNACDLTYMSFLRDEAWRLLGSDTQLYTTDGPGERHLKCGSVEGVLATVGFGPTTPQKVGENFEIQRQFLRNRRGPLVNSEFHAGFHILWGQRHRQLPTDEALISTAMTMWAKGASINFYMIHGGTNFGFWNGAEPHAPVITSYDYSAPIGEEGVYRPAYKKIRNWIKRIPGWENEPTLPPRISKKKAYASVSMQLMGPVMQFGKACSASTNPLSFADLGWSSGYILYYTHLDKCGRNLTIEKVHDFGYVRLAGKPQGRFVNNFWGKNATTVVLKDCRDHDSLEIIVENQGRQTYETINDFKGILSFVYLDGNPVTEWIQCGMGGPQEKMKDLLFDEGESALEGNGVDDTDELDESDGAPGLYLGEFIVERVADTWVNMTSWEKGHVIVNGHNIGRYWSKEGPQYNLYIPAPLLQKGRNFIAVYELIHVSGCGRDSCPLPFSSSADIHFDRLIYDELHTNYRRSLWKNDKSRRRKI